MDLLVLADFEEGSPGDALPGSTVNAQGYSQNSTQATYTDVNHSGARAALLSSEPGAPSSVAVEIDGVPISEAGFWLRYSALPIDGLLGGQITFLGGPWTAQADLAINTNGGATIFAIEVSTTTGGFASAYFSASDHVDEWLRFSCTSGGVVSLSREDGSVIASATCPDVRLVPYTYNRVGASAGSPSVVHGATLVVDDFYYVPLTLTGSTGPVRRAFMRDPNAL